MHYPLTTIYAGRVEGIPFFHVNPGSRALTIGTYGCNLDCRYCMNQHLLNEPAFFFDLDPGQVAAKAKLAGCSLVSFSANEPAVSFEYFIDIAQACRETSLLVGCSSNGLFSERQIERLAPTIDCINVSLKGPSDAFYREMCGGGSLKRVLECVRTLQATGVHVELTTPYVPVITREQMLAIAHKIAAIDRAIPWHIFRLLPEYKLTDSERTRIDDMVGIRERASGELDYIYLENFAGSVWLDTLCPACQAVLVKRMSSRGCGGTFLESRLTGGCCPACGRPAGLSLKGGAAIDEETPAPDTRTAYIEIGGWTNVVEMGSGTPLSPREELPLHDVMSADPYPGDLVRGADAWVTRIGRAVVERYRPALVVLTYAQPAFVGRHKADGELWRAFVQETHTAVSDFLEAVDYDYLVIGLGDLEEVRGSINLERVIGGIASADEGIACLYHATAEDARKVALLPGVQRVIARQELLSAIPYASGVEALGDYFVIPEPGYHFLALSSSSRYTYRTPSLDRLVPAWASFEVPGSLAGVRQALTKRLEGGQRLALILVEGVGMKGFPFPVTAGMDNTIGGLIPVGACAHQFMIISSGQALFAPCFAYPHWRVSPQVNPFARSTPPLESCLTRDAMLGGRGVCSIGNRSIFTHAAFPCDLTVECHCAGLHNYGSLVVMPS